MPTNEFIEELEGYLDFVSDGSENGISSSEAAQIVFRAINEEGYWHQAGDTTELFDTAIALGMELQGRRMVFDADGNLVEGDEGIRQSTEINAPVLSDADLESISNMIRIGAKFEGSLNFAERTVMKEQAGIERLAIYCPENTYCFFACVEKYYQIRNGMTSAAALSAQINRHGINPYADNKQKLVKRVKQTYPDFDLPICQIKARKKRSRTGGFFTFTAMDKAHARSQSEYFIALVPCNSSSYHAILVNRALSKYITPDDLKFRMIRCLTLFNEWKLVKPLQSKTRRDYVIIYDIETYIHEEERMIPRKRIVLRDGQRVEIPETRAERFRNLVPYSLSWALIKLNRSEAGNLVSHESSEIFNITVKDDTNNEADTQIFDEFYAQIIEKSHDLSVQFGVKWEEGIQVFAHNGSKFDTIYAKAAKTGKIESQIGSNSHLKSFDVTIGKCKPSCKKGISMETKLPKCAECREKRQIKMIFRDTLPFTLNKLSVLSAKYVPEELRKKEFDIVDKPKQWYIENDILRSQNAENDWREYLTYDIVSLTHIFVFFEKVYNTKLGVSMTTACGLPGLAWELVDKTSYPIQGGQLYIPVSPSVVSFIHAATYGGRVMCLKSEFKSKGKKDRLMCGDANSLYPSAMCKSFPIGKAHLINDLLRDKSEWGKTRSAQFSENEVLPTFDQIRAKARHYIIEIEFEIPNDPTKPIRFIPYKTDNEDNQSRLFYPGAGTYRGVYNDVDIEEMITEGYKINKVFTGFFWTKSSPFLKDYVEALYAERKRLVAAKDSSEIAFKLMLNASYGKFLEAIKDSTSFYFGERKDKADVKWANGQWQSTKKLDNPIVEKPSYIGSYILAYARQIMNEYIRKIGIHNIYYSDTDSIYCTVDAFERSGIVESTELGGLKNDYGAGCFIDRAIFLDQKKYLLRKISPSTGATSISAKFLGIGGKIANNVRSSMFGDAFRDKDDFELLEAFYLELLKQGNDPIPIVRAFWERNKSRVSICDKEMMVSITPKKKMSAMIHHGEFNPTGIIVRRTNQVRKVCADGRRRIAPRETQIETRIPNPPPIIQYTSIVNAEIPSTIFDSYVKHHISREDKEQIERESVIENFEYSSLGQVPFITSALPIVIRDSAQYALPNRNFNNARSSYSFWTTERMIICSKQETIRIDEALLPPGLVEFARIEKQMRRTTKVVLTDIPAEFRNIPIDGKYYPLHKLILTVDVDMKEVFKIVIFVHHYTGPCGPTIKITKLVDPTSLTPIVGNRIYTAAIANSQPYSDKIFKHAVNSFYQ